MACRELLERNGATTSRRMEVWGVPTGGTIVALRLAQTGLAVALDEWEPGALVVDDIVDSGRTARALDPVNDFDALFRSAKAPKDLAENATVVDDWVQFPWEHSASPEDAVVRLLEFMGEDPRREGLRETPRRVTGAFAEMTAGYAMDPAKFLKVVFDERCDQMVVLRGIRFTSLCEHHLLPFVGTATVGYLPDKKVVGLSKLARVVECYAKRLQVQERMTNQIADAIMEHVAAKGAAVVLKAHHSCMGCHGVRQPDAEMVTSALRGAFLSEASARAEFLGL